jgi:hypothetical protein
MSIKKLINKKALLICGGVSILTGVVGYACYKLGSEHMYNAIDSKIDGIIFRAYDEGMDAQLTAIYREDPETYEKLLEKGLLDWKVTIPPASVDFVKGLYLSHTDKN